MAQLTKSFWTDLINHYQDREELQVRLWNGYVGWKLPYRLRGEEPQSGWPQYVVDAPLGGWPELTEREKSLLDQLAAENGGYPSWNKHPFMDFSAVLFDTEINFSNLTLIAVDFSKACFLTNVKFNRTRFFMQSRFTEVVFSGNVDFYDTFFEADVKFDNSRFEGSTFFENVEFNGGGYFLSI